MRVYGAGTAMKLELQMRKLTALWNPANGFDHVAFTIFIQAPGTSGGMEVMPLQNATLPQGMRWHYRLRAHGWTNAMFSSAGASKDEEGTAITPAPTIEADLADLTVVLTIPASASVSCNRCPARNST